MGGFLLSLFFGILLFFLKKGILKKEIVIKNPSIKIEKKKEISLPIKSI